MGISLIRSYNMMDMRRKSFESRASVVSRLFLDNIKRRWPGEGDLKWYIIQSFLKSCKIPQKPLYIDYRFKCTLCKVSYNIAMLFRKWVAIG